MKRTLILGIILLSLVGTYFLLNNSDDKKIEAIKADRNFAVPGEEIEKVIIIEKSGKISTLTHENEIWFNNGNRITLNQKNLLFEALSRIRLESIPPKGAYNQIMKTIGKIGILVRVYGKDDKLIRSYYVGGVPQGERGTYYLMENSNQPYLMSLPGMEGSTRGRFIKKDDEWLDRAMFRYPDKDIAKISVEYPRSQNDSYTILKLENGYEVKPFYNFTPVIKKEMNQRVIEDYLDSYYVGFYTEAYVNELKQKDSIIQNMKPFCNIIIENEVGEKNELNLYSFNEVFGYEGEATGPEVDKFIERYYVNVNKGENFMLTQQIIAKKFLWGYKYFFK